MLPRSLIEWNDLEPALHIELQVKLVLAFDWSRRSQLTRIVKPCTEKSPDCWLLYFLFKQSEFNVTDSSRDDLRWDEHVSRAWLLIAKHWPGATVSLDCMWTGLDHVKVLRQICMTAKETGMLYGERMVTKNKDCP